jgi:dipeptidyl-peptidase-4
MTNCNCRKIDNDYPERAALTGNFRKGAPRSFVVNSQSKRVGFVRTSGPDSAQLDLWVVENLDGKPSERCVVKANDLFSDSENLSATERARRERLRESGAGITAFSVDSDFSAVTFALSGRLWHVTIDGKAKRVGNYDSVVDPTISPDGKLIAFSEGADFVVAAIDGKEVFRKASEGQYITYGLADFIASEELGRYRGHWWSPESNAILFERNDETQVDVRWIADPTFPESEPRPHKYPSAGTKNSEVGLFVLNLETGNAAELNWDKKTFEYLGQVSWGKAGAHISVLNRAQDQMIGYTINQDSLAQIKLGKESQLTDIYKCSDKHWLNAETNFPAVKSNGEIFTKDDASTIAGVEPYTLVALNETDFIIGHYNEPWQFQFSKFGFDGVKTELTRADGYAGGLFDGDYGIAIQHALDLPTAKYQVKRNGETIYEIESFAEKAKIDPKPIIASISDRSLPTAVFFPENHQVGSHKLPVVVSIYGGPQHSEVIAATSPFAGNQWLANQGYAVVVIDNAGTPGKGGVWEREVKNDLTQVILNDQVKGLQAIFAQYPNDMDSTRVGINGWSFGGYLSALAVIDRPDVYHAAWAGAPVTDWRLYDSAYSERYLGHPEQNAAVYDNQSLIKKAYKLTRPLTLIHGLADDNVLAAHSLQLSGALLAAGISHNFIPLAGVSHMTPQVDIAKNLMLLMRDFFDANL